MLTSGSVPFPHLWRVAWRVAAGDRAGGRREWRPGALAVGATDARQGADERRTAYASDGSSFLLASLTGRGLAAAASRRDLGRRGGPPRCPGRRGRAGGRRTGPAHGALAGLGARGGKGWGEGQGGGAAAHPLDCVGKRGGLRLASLSLRLHVGKGITTPLQWDPLLCLSVCMPLVPSRPRPHSRTRQTGARRRTSSSTGNLRRADSRRRPAPTPALPQRRGTRLADRACPKW